MFIERCPVWFRHPTGPRLRATAFFWDQVALTSVVKTPPTHRRVFQDGRDKLQRRYNNKLVTFPYVCLQQFDIVLHFSKSKNKLHHL